MKFDWMDEEGEKYPVKIVHKGKVQTPMLHNLSPAQHAWADQQYPAPERPTDDGFKDEAIAKAWIEKFENRNLCFAVMALGSENFAADTVVAQMEELRPSPNGGLSWTAINTIAKAAYDRLSLTPEMLEAAKEGNVPFAATPPAPQEIER